MLKSVNSKQSHGFKEQLKIGRSIADQLQVVTPLSQVAAQMNLSKTMVRRIELLALYKLTMRMRQLRAQEEV